MKILLIKSNKDEGSFRFAKGMGMNVLELEDNDDIDKKLKEYIKKDYKNIIVSNEIAGFSEDIIKKYSNSKDIKIYIAPSKRE